MSKVVDRITCPICVSEGLDTEGDNLTIFADGAYACAAKKEHTKLVAKLRPDLVSGQSNSKSKRAISNPRASKKSSPGRIIVAEYSYQNPDGQERYQSVRMEPKTFRLRRRLNGAWVWNMEGIERVLYRLPKIAKADQVWVTEGEKDVYTLESCGIVATTSAGGADNWQDQYAESLRGKDIVVCGDNDAPGEKYIRAVIASALPVAKSVRRVRIPAPHKDVSDYVAAVGVDKVALSLGDLLAAAPVETVVIEPETIAISANSTNSPPLPPQTIPQADYPKDSILNDFVTYARTQSEAQDSILVGSIIPVIAGCLARRVYLKFGAKKYPNVYNMVVARPGERKSSTVQIVQEIATRLLPDNSFVWGVASDQALFKTYQANPDKVWIISEGNPLLANWAHDAAGKQVAKRMLDLYDCQKWNQNYIRLEEETGIANQTIAETSTSFLIATTFNSARFNGLETRDGMRRRTSYYVSEGLARIIHWPADNPDEKNALIMGLQPLLALSGEIKLSADALELWKAIQDDNRAQIDKVHGFDAASEALGTTLSESPSKILKRAMIFEICRWLKDSSRDWKSIQADTLQTSANHEAFCIHSSSILDTIGIRAEVRSEADILLAKIRTDFAHKANGGWIVLTRSEITSKFASHSNRPGTLTPERIYNHIVPDLAKRGLAKQESKSGKREAFAFATDDRSGGYGEFVENGENE